MTAMATLARRRPVIRRGQTKPLRLGLHSAADDVNNRLLLDRGDISGILPQFFGLQDAAHNFS